ncbi:HAMP domain-containing sensor histidine kinase [Pseudalkalibacillus caeni]|uniref:histidine kinase n=1 Tax=Exobacillus caeni TaxID=2574798 RepID=A0A5R9F640_9BACL|nr:HAMP domain-containing sensor histidine kinase [Pseudalkalibacillus caeni]TLS37098.1 HAMP domain-containing histidine kinase [Pseudalkalibacillus caeni]
MKWKLTSRFLTAIIITIVLSLFAVYLFFTLFFYRGNPDTATFLPVEAPTMTLDFEKYLAYTDGQFRIEKEGIQQLKKTESWVQVLDENGTVVFEKYAPEAAPAHYTPAKLIFYHKYGGAIKGNTIFVGTADRGEREFSYIMGFPVEKVSKAGSFTFSPETIQKDLFRMFLIIVGVIVLIATVIGYLFSRKMATPLLKIIRAIQGLASGTYEGGLKEKGLYKEVYKNLNGLSATLKANEIERQRLEKVREEWITNITHDVKTPLASIKGYSEMLMEYETDLTPDEKLQYTRIIQEKANYIEGLTEDLKITYQLNQSVLPLKKEKGNLTDTIRETIISILNHPGYEEVPIHFESESEEIIFYYDEKLIQRMLSNLIYNAIVHNPAGTDIEVSVANHNGIFLTIKDNGAGIEEAEIDRLFERYYRGTNTGEAHKGSGLGMAIAKQIIEAHDGSVEIKSAPDVGTEITITF